jgi:hypothetical protein
MRAGNDQVQGSWARAPAEKTLLNYLPHLDCPSKLPCASTVSYHGNLRAVSARTRSSRTWESRTSSTQRHFKWHSSRRLHGASALHVTHGQSYADSSMFFRILFLLQYKTPIKHVLNLFLFIDSLFTEVLVAFQTTARKLRELSFTDNRPNRRRSHGTSPHNSRSHLRNSDTPPTCISELVFLILITLASSPQK